MAKFRYMVSDAAAAAAFYTENFGFSIELQVPAILYCLLGRPDTLAQRPQKLSPPPDARWTSA
jgi:catechol 2,3-dioxygenase-like lactoylglutathione lyase family enzyme